MRVAVASMSLSVSRLEEDVVMRPCSTPPDASDIVSGTRGGEARGERWPAKGIRATGPYRQKGAVSLSLCPALHASPIDLEKALSCNLSMDANPEPAHVFRRVFALIAINCDRRAFVPSPSCFDAAPGQA